MRGVKPQNVHFYDTCSNLQYVCAYISALIKEKLLRQQAGQNYLEVKRVFSKIWWVKTMWNRWYPLVQSELIFYIEKGIRPIYNQHEDVEVYFNNRVPNKTGESKIMHGRHLLIEWNMVIC